MRGLFERLISTFRRRSPERAEARQVAHGRGPLDHVVLLDGTMGSLRADRLTSIGLIYRFLRRAAPKVSVYYGRGLQWREWHDVSDVWFGFGVNKQIERAYGWLAMRYRPGDRVFLIGYSRGAFAARSLAGMIERVGLLRPEHAIERNTRLAWRHYEGETPAPIMTGFRHSLCHERVPIEMVGVFDTVQALGVRLPFFWLVREAQVRFHDHQLGQSVNHGYQALALDETRSVLEPMVWDSEGTGATRIEQCWFRGAHGDIGGQLGHFGDARPLANIPLVWMLEKAETLGLALPPGWQQEFPRDPGAPSVGTWGGWAKLFWLRAPRVVGRDPSEGLHDSVTLPERSRALFRPRILRPEIRRLARDSELGRHDETGGGAGGVKTPILGAPDLTPRDAG
ncbi:DUF2235 domain-containing protein [Thioclava pacifica]|uniref:T6SS Phospholipase effector Tle1-like catalytic domain-containing protein n=1 Tax=Thioclava pacifica DSM 10166 TaxID=1353537 RepID=A0A074J538_9RHOB|nr:DUF2235 domain-containing protein [Thioclava pacifica]KEO50733.1 hypothetical protein TP2_13980 [Thioclava pacifica DSM 10166]